MLAASIPSQTLVVTASPPMDGLEITYRLRRLGHSQSKVGRELGVSQAVVNNTIHGRVTCHRVAVYVAELLGETIHNLWPGRYDFKPRPPRSQIRIGKEEDPMS